MVKSVDNLKSIIRENRPNISASSVLTYSSLLKSMYLTHNDNIDNMTLDWFSDPDNIMKSLEGKPSHARKTSIAALIVLLGDKKPDAEIIKLMNKDAEEIKEKYSGQKMNEKQEKNWMTSEEVNAVESKALDVIKPWLNKSAGSLSPEQLRMIMDWLLLALTTGKYFPPRRSEWTHIKLKDVDQEKDNYIDLKKGVFVLNQYKTAKLYGREEIPYGKEFGTYLKKILKLIPEQTYLLENKGKPFTAPLVTTRLNKIFGKNVSTSMLRHIWVSNKYADIPKISELKATAEAMGHDISTHMEYVLHK